LFSQARAGAQCVAMGAEIGGRGAALQSGVKARWARSPTDPGQLSGRGAWRI
jgi:hypothetical protein